MKLLPPVLLVAAASPACSIPHISEIIERIHEQKLDPQPQMQLEVKFSKSHHDVQTLTFDQRLDHFSQENNNDYETFKQRYFYTSRYVHTEEENFGGSVNTKRNTISFLCVGGEGPSLDPSVLVDSVHCTGDMIELALKLYLEQDWDVHLYALEHRYYGKSFPKINKSQNGEAYLRANEQESDNDNEFRHLSSRQAVRDIVEFVKSSEASQHLKTGKINNNDINVRWITFGGSYPGMLAGWSRLLHPDVIYGAVANSAPVQAEANFRKYNDHVGLDLGEESLVGGSKLCLDIFQSGHDEVAAIVEGGDADEIDRVVSAFNVCDGASMLMKDRKNIDFFVGYSMLPIEVQSNDPSCDEPLCNIQKVSTRERKYVGCFEIVYSPPLSFHCFIMVGM